MSRLPPAYWAFGRCGVWLIASVLLLSRAGQIQAQPAIEGYANYEMLAIAVRAIDESDTATVASLGKTLGGRDIFLITISRGAPESKPAILVVGNVEATHLVGSELALRLAQQMAKANADSDVVKQLLERFTIYVIPRPNPDASEHFFRKPWIERSGNDRVTDDDRDGETDEDAPEDLNNDGLISVMRVEDEGGPYIPHPSDARVLIKADAQKNERGRYALYTEGRDDDGDEKYNEDGPGGVSFNRNFPHRYAYFEPLSGPHQVSEIETRAVADFAFAHSNIALVFTFSPEDNLMEPWKPAQGAEASRGKSAINASDSEHVNFLAEQYREMLGAKDAPNSPAAAGSFTEWAYYQYGRWSLSARGWWIPKVPVGAEAVDAAKDLTAKAPERKAGPKQPDQEKRGADDLNALAWFKNEAIDGFIDWQPFEHPDFPGKKVEIGGFKPFLRLNPPAKELEPLATKHLQFITRLAELMPRIEIASTEVKPLGGGVFRVTAKVVNSGYLPTMANVEGTSREAYPLQIKIELPPGAKLLTGHPRTRLDRLMGGGDKTEQTWLVLSSTLGREKVTVSVSSPSVGQAAKSVELK